MIIWLVFKGRFVHPPNSELGTIYHLSMESPKFASIVGYEKDNKSALKPVFVYMFLHLVVSLIMIALSYPLILNAYVHTIFCLFLFSWAAWNGAIKYYSMMTRYYEKKLTKLLDL